MSLDRSSSCHCCSFGEYLGNFATNGFASGYVGMECVMRSVAGTVEAFVAKQQSFHVYRVRFTSACCCSLICVVLGSSDAALRSRPQSQ